LLSAARARLVIRVPLEAVRAILCSKRTLPSCSPGPVRSWSIRTKVWIVPYRR